MSETTTIFIYRFPTYTMFRIIVEPNNLEPAIDIMPL